MSRDWLAFLIVGSGLLAASAVHAQSDDSSPAESAAHSGDKPPAESAERRSKDLAPPIPRQTRETTAPPPVNPWFVRPPFALTVGAASDWKLTIFGFAEADAMRDSTRSFNDGLNNNVVAHARTQAGDNPRLQFIDPEQPHRIQHGGARLRRNSFDRAARIRPIRESAQHQQRRRLAPGKPLARVSRRRRRTSITPRSGFDTRI